MTLQNKLNSVFVTVGSLLMIFAAIFFSGPLGEGISSGILLCGERLIPSLLPFMILSSYLFHSGAMETVSALISPFTRHILRLPQCCGGVFLLSLISGYPVGARLTASLVEKGEIDPKTAERLLCCSINGGPAFLICAVGERMLGDRTVGVILFVASVSASVITMILLGFPHPVTPRQALKKPKLRFFDPLVQAVSESTGGMLGLCGFVLCFSALTELFSFFLGNPEKNTPFHFLFSFICGIFEVTCGTAELSSHRDLLGILGISSLLSFSGISVLAQAGFFLRKKGVSLKGFLMARLIHIPLSMGITWGLCRLFPRTMDVFLPPSPVFGVSEHPEVSLLCLGMLAVGALSLPRRKNKIQDGE